MMLVAPRIIAIDDNPDHLRGLVAGLHHCGTSCFPIHFTGDPIDLRSCRDLRLMFADLHLNESGAGGQYERHFALIGGLIQETFTPCGPYMLILWTRFADQATKLQDFLESRLEDVAKPLAVVPLDKKDHLNLTNGTVKNPAKLADAIIDIVTGQPQLAALLNWEERILGAAAESVSSILRMTNSAPDAPSRCAELARLLAQLATQAVGRDHVDRDRFQAVNEALVPILADRVSFLPTRGDDSTIWSGAFSAADAGAALSIEEAGRLNRMLHVSEANGLRASDRGAVGPLPKRIQGSGFSRCFGMDPATAAQKQFGCTGYAPDNAAFRWVLVQTQAACDFAQRQPGPLPYLLGLEVPCTYASKGSPPRALWKSPPFEIREAVSCLHVNCRFQVVVPPGVAEKMPAHYRLREQCLNLLIYCAHVYSARPGVIAFSGGKVG